MAFARLGGIGLDIDNLLRVQAGLQRGQPHYQLEDRARHVILVSGTVLLGVQLADALPFLARDASHIPVRVERRRRHHCQDVAGVHVHDDHRAACGRAGDTLQRALRRPLKIQVNRQHHVPARLGRAPDVLGLPVAGVVDQDRFGAGSAPQLLITSHTRCRGCRGNPAAGRKRTPPPLLCESSSRRRWPRTCAAVVPQG